MTHEGLVKRLRTMCPEDYNNPMDFAYGAEQAMSEAADAIEELSRVADAIPHVCECCIGCEVETGGCDRGFVLSPKRAREYLSKPRWIPVTKGLPKTRESILGKKSNKVIVAFRFGDGTQGTDTAHTLNGEWVFEDHITVVERTITHWQPLPEPPKENGKSET